MESRCATTTPASSCHIGKKADRKRKAEEDVLSLVRERLSRPVPQEPKEDEHDTFARTLAYKMRKLNREQCLHAEKLIGEIMYEAAQDNLSRETRIVNMPTHMPRYEEHGIHQDVYRSYTTMN